MSTHQPVGGRGREVGLQGLPAAGVFFTNDAKNALLLEAGGGGVQKFDIRDSAAITDTGLQELRIARLYPAPPEVLQETKDVKLQVGDAYRHLGKMVSRDEARSKLARKS
ncbi:MAG: hypothetical protein KDD47_15320 [Acidobacteria bacterium]|nr:hypothetical protein [Acidobacteriota bacterium]